VEEAAAVSELTSPLQRDAGPTSFALDVVGVGALNLDYIASVSALAGQPRSRSLTSQISELVEKTGAPLEWGTERSVDDQTIYAAIEAVSSAGPDTSLGGSAFNAIHAIAQAQAGLRLGYVGVAGRVPVIGVSSIQQFEALGVDHRFVLRDDQHLCGICFSFCEADDRTLLTHMGANGYMAEYIDQRFDDIVAYLSSARLIHVTSFLDDRTAGRLLAVLRAVKDASPGTAISFDPGHIWSVDSTLEIEGLIEISDYLLVNYREFHELGGYKADEPDEEVAGRLLRRFSNDRGFVIVKRPTGIWSYRREDGKVVSDFYAQIPLEVEEVKDATGAGDVFAAGLLIVLTSDRLQVELGSLLGMRLARHKLRYVGSAGHGQFAQVTRDFISNLDRQRRSDGQPKGVFIAHGANPEWLAVRRFIEERFELPVHSFESSSWGGRQITEALSDYLERCGFAICVLTPEDLSGDGRHLARQNVIHEVGLFQGRHGFDRVLVLAEDGCEFVPRTAKPYTIFFPHNGIDRTFYRLSEMIRSQGFGYAEER
jgi:sugar/nucleoside kinase (ribokinase family)